MIRYSISTTFVKHIFFLKPNKLFPKFNMAFQNKLMSLVQFTLLPTGAGCAVNDWLEELGGADFFELSLFTWVQ